MKAITRQLKKVVALGVGLTMIGATIAGAGAQDLGNAAVLLNDATHVIVGGAGDTLASAQIMGAAAAAGGGSGGTGASAVGGDSWMVGTVSDQLEYDEQVGPTSSGVVDFAASAELPILLADGTFTNTKGSFDYEQRLHFDDAGQQAVYEEDDYDTTADFFTMDDGTQVFLYELDFSEQLETDVDVSENNELDDVEGKDITLLGRTYNIVKAEYDGSDGVTLELASGATRGSLNIGETAQHTLDGVTYEVTLDFTNSNDQSSWTIDGVSTGTMDESESYRVSGGVTFIVNDVSHNDYSGGTQRGSYTFGGEKMTLTDTNVTDTTFGVAVQVNEETISEATTRFTGTFPTRPVTGASGTDGILNLDKLEINVTSDNDYHIGIGESLLGQVEIADDNKELHQWFNIDIYYEGPTTPGGTVYETKLASRNGEKEYWVTTTNIRGTEIELPVAYASAGSAMRPGEQNDNFVFVNTTQGTIQDEYYFILNDDTDEDSNTNVVQYKGADKSSDDAPKVRFRVEGVAGTLERPYSTGSSGVTLTRDGTTYTFINASPDTAKDFNMTLSSGGSNTLTAYQTDGMQQPLFGIGGLKILLSDPNTSLTSDQLLINFTAIDTDASDEATVELLFGANVTVSSQELDLGTTTGLTLVSQADDDDRSTTIGTHGFQVTELSPSGSGTTSNEVTILHTAGQRLPQVFVGAVGLSFSGGAATSTAAATTTSSTLPVAALDTEAPAVFTTGVNMILVGGPCVNSVSAAVLGSSGECTDGFENGKAKLQIFKDASVGTGWALLVAGYSADDTRRAAMVLTNSGDYPSLAGMEAEVSGTTLSNIAVGAPTVV